MTNLKVAKTVARLRDITIQPRELVDEWILITYDLPVTEEGNAIRGKFLKMAPKIGAVMHSRSVYLMPNTKEAQMAAVELSSIGDVYIWTSKIGEEKNKALTKFYDKKLIDQVANIESRIKKMEKLTLDGKFGMAERMRLKSINLYQQLLFAVAQRGNTSIIQDLVNIEGKLETGG